MRKIEVTAVLKDLSKAKVAEILPQSIRGDKKIYSAAVALDSQLEKILDASKLVLHLPRLDELDHDVLDYLAWQFHCDFYRQDLPLTAKRNQIRESIFWHRIKGTPAGVEKSLATYMAGAKVEENWEYGGEPYFFRIVCNGLKFFTAEKDFIDLIDNAKNVRSWLEGIIFDLTIDEPENLVHAIAELESGKEEILTNLEKLSEQENLFHAIAELEESFEVTGYGGEQTWIDERKYFVATAELESGIEILNLLAPPPIDDYWFEKWLREKWREWNLNPVVKPYRHPDDEIDPFDPDDFPIDANFLKIYFQYPDNRYKFLTIYNPRDDITKAEIRALGVLSKDLFKSSTGTLSTGIARAFYYDKKTTKIF